jgi:hypothetical protein
MRSSLRSISSRRRRIKEKLFRRSLGTEKAILVADDRAHRDLDRVGHSAPVNLDLCIAGLATAKDYLLTAIEASDALRPVTGKVEPAGPNHAKRRCKQAHTETRIETDSG